ncbi:unnamed protein product [marine sediment metagenome]|uniref:Tetratricopeptide repeat protein n=1 Tax=marine sediment metagenome TaxID=412755 RepID=X1U5K4_9ZZZZ
MTNEDVPELQSIWDDARRFTERGDYDKAIEIYQYILIRYSDYPVAVELGSNPKSQDRQLSGSLTMDPPLNFYSVLLHRLAVRG